MILDVSVHLPLWRNWQTHLTQSQSGTRAGSSPASGTLKALNFQGFFFFGFWPSGPLPSPGDQGEGLPLHFQGQGASGGDFLPQEHLRGGIFHLPADEPPQGTRALGHTVAPPGRGDRAGLVRLKRDAARRGAGNGLRTQPPRDLGAVLAR